MRSPTSLAATDPASPAAPPGRLRVEWQGLVPYPAALELQETTHALRVAGRCPDTLLLLEHPPVVTLGRGSALAREAIPRAALEAQGVAVCESGRGGRATYHGPGQLVGYPILPLPRFGLDVPTFVRQLEGAMLDAVRARGVAAARRQGYPGIWVGRRKIGAVGIHVRRLVTVHGFALNLTVDASAFGAIVPCGIRPGDGTISSLAELAGSAPSPAELAPEVARRLIRRLQGAAAAR